MIVELRQYTLRPGRRDDLIDLFDAEFIESQERLGMAVLGQFRDLDRPDRFVWLRGFADMAVRRRGLQEFYSGPVWKEHGPAANATMLDSDDVLLLREIVPVPRTAGDGSPLTATIWFRDHPFDAGFTDWFAARATGAVAVLSTEYAANDFPALPVREGEHAFVWLARHDDTIEPPSRFAVTATDRLHLSPTARSALR
ncbi:NIPSNAP family containing protein [Actinoplanes philippinensis]|uniref:NIPSNAP protein n=1 Tax=Actinoplanes philippinensis TaxID=35752 RepID=A0A1I2KGR9_9ACTN|nr:NIPSNAP family protein [Actinoplanes philippinensis]GIE81878.1 NIPSNAP family containing protein [Actinoplanes philippinensis]SFF64311.1 NIPSNAP protein [Actinoplanes philippinensis]